MSIAPGLADVPLPNAEGESKRVVEVENGKDSRRTMRNESVTMEWPVSETVAGKMLVGQRRDATTQTNGLRCPVVAPIDDEETWPGWVSCLGLGWLRCLTVDPRTRRRRAPVQLQLRGAGLGEAVDKLRVPLRSGAG